MCGCGGGFDFLHSMLLYPELVRLGKKVTILSFSFGVVKNLQRADVVFSGQVPPDHAPPECKLVTNKTGSFCSSLIASSEWESFAVGSTRYQPEVGLREFLDVAYPASAPHSIYACYARAWTTKQLAALYDFLCAKHEVDSIIVFDGGSDSLMVKQTNRKKRKFSYQNSGVMNSDLEIRLKTQ